MGALAGVRVVEFAGIGPGPFCAMMLADHGADVIRIDRPSVQLQGQLVGAVEKDVLNRGRRSIGLDLKRAEDVALALDLVARADALIEGTRPGVMERLGLGPDACLARNPRLVYGRMTGWGQAGPWAMRAGHDINYLGLSGGLQPIGPADRPPPPPLNYVADFGGGGLMLAFGIVAALLAARASGRGQVVDAAMVDGAALQTTMFHAFLQMGTWTEARGANVLDGGAPFYRCYACADGRFVAVGCLEPQFYAAMLDRLGLAGDPAFAAQNDRAAWPAMAERLEAVFATRARDDWAAHFEGSDACVTPVLGLGEAGAHPHMAARGTIVEEGGLSQPAPSPRMSETPPVIARGPAVPDADRAEVLKDWLGR